MKLDDATYVKVMSLVTHCYSRLYVSSLPYNVTVHNEIGLYYLDFIFLLRNNCYPTHYKIKKRVNRRSI